MEWKDLFKQIKEKNYSTTLKNFLDKEYSEFIVYPKRENVFNAFKLTPLNNLKVVIIGQDPYHEPNQAMGLSFSVPEGIEQPPSLKNIFKEIGMEYGVEITTKSGDLTYLAKQGVLLLNSILTVRKGLPMSHNIKEYEMLFDDILKFIESNDQPIVYFLWGNSARKYRSKITNKNHIVIECVHPSPLSANRGGWFNSGIFKKCNDFLSAKMVEKINWIP